MKKFTTSALGDRIYCGLIPQLPTFGNDQMKIKVLLAGLGFVSLALMLSYLILPSSSEKELHVDIQACQTVFLEQMGVEISSATHLGKTQVKVDHSAVLIEGKNSIKRVVKIEPSKDRDLDASLDFYYQEPELGDLDENKLILYSSVDQGKTWQPHFNSKVDPDNNSIHLDGIEHFSLWTAGVPEVFTEESTTALVTAFVVTTNADSGPGSLRQAITDANAAGAGPHSITFDPSLSGQTITLASHLPVVGVSDVTIDGDIDNDGTGDITIDANGGDITRYIFRGNANADNATFNGFTLQDTGYEPFRFDGSPTGVTISNMVWRHTQNNWQNYGVNWNGNATDLTIRNVVMTQKQNFGGGAIYITGTATNVMIDNFDLSESGGGGLQAIRINGASNNVTIKNCDLDLDLLTSTDDGNYGIWFRSTATNILIDSCNIYDAEIYGIYFENVATDVTISNTNLDNANGYETVQMIRFHSTVNGLTMTDVDINCEKTDNGTNVNDGDYGIVFAGAINADPAKTATLTRVSVHAADLDNIYVHTTTRNLTLEECSITGLNQQHGNEDGIEFYNNVLRSNIVINNCTFDKNGRAGLLINCASGSTEFNITNNTFTNADRGSAGHGIWLYSGNGNKAITIEGNTFADNKYNGIYNPGPDGINITQNSMYNNGSIGIDNAANSGNNDFEYNEGDVPYIISSVPLSGDDYTVTFSLPAFCTNCDVEFFTNDPDDAMFQGRTYAQTETGLASGTHTATVNSGGNNTGFWTATLKSNTHNGSVSEYSFQAAINPVGPGCVAAGIRLWLRGDDVASGNIYTGGGWSDFSGNNYDFTLGGSDPNRVDGGLNFNHYVDFDANDHLYQPSFVSFFTSGEVFSVLQARASTGGHAYNFGGQSNNHYRTVDTYESFGTNDRKGWRNSNNAVLDGSGVVVTPAPLFDPTEWNFYNVSADGVANNWKAFFNGFQKVNDASNVANFGDTYSRIGHGDASYFNGNVSEVVLYNRALTAAERQRVNSYLAIKYGITMDQTNATDYLAGDGSVVWPAGGGYDNDIAGIARDDCQALNQKQSLSINDDAFVTIGLGEVAADNASNANTFGADKSFLLWGNDDAILALQFTELPAAANAGNQRLTREWKVKETGSVSNLVVKAGTDNFTIPGGASNIEMYVDTDGDGDFSTGSPTILAANDFTDGVATFTGVDLDDNDVFTFGWFQIAPGCVGGGLKVWLKGDEGITQETGVASWADQSGAGNDVIQATTSRQPLYNENAVNFNPAPEFDGSNDFLRNASIDGGSSNGTNSREVIVVTGGLTNINRTIWNYGHHPDQRSLQLWNRETNRFWTRSNGSTATNASKYYTKANQNDVGVLSLRNEDGDNMSNFILRQDGNELPNSASNTRSTNLTTAELHIGVHEANNTALNSYYQGPITEFILYENPLTATDRQKVESYLAIKYGITLATDYLAGDGSTIRVLGGGFDHDIAGIGRDNCQELNQKQSRSVNEDAVVTMGLGAIAATNASNGNTFPTDRSFMLWGNNDGDLSADATAPPSDNIIPALSTPSLQGLNAWMKRRWLIAEKNTVGTVKVRFQFSSFSNAYLLTASDAAFTNDVTYTALTQVGDDWEGTYDFSDGEYFTLAGIQTAPGCVVSDLQLWLRADNGLTVDGSLNATNWVDQSGNSRNADIIIGDPQRLDASLNYNPVIDFDGNDHLRFTSSPFVNGFTAAEAIVVVKDDVYNACNCGHPYDFGGSSRGYHYTWGNANIYQGSFTNNRLGFNPLANTIIDGKPGVASIIGDPVDTRNWNIYGTHGTTNDWGVQFNGNFKALTSTNTFNTSLAAGNEHIGAVSGTAFNGDIAEVILYNRVLTTNERQKVNSYLGVKYGLTLGHNYLAGNDTIIWDLAQNPAFNNDIAGIGRDNCQNLSQRQSKSISDDALLTMGLGSLAVDNKSNPNVFTNDGGFMLWGNNNGIIDVDTAALPGTSPATLNVWLDRKWLIQETTEDPVGSVRTRFEYFRFSNVHLVTADDAAFTTNVTYTPLTQVGANWEGDYDFADGQYFTIAGKLTAPGCVPLDLVAWYKADVAIPVGTSWEDLSGNNNDAGVDGIAPILEQSIANFNPAYDYSGGFTLLPNFYPLQSSYPYEVFFVNTQEAPGGNLDLWSNDMAPGGCSANPTVFSNGYVDGTSDLTADPDIMLYQPNIINVNRTAGAVGTSSTNGGSIRTNTNLGHAATLTGLNRNRLGGRHDGNCVSRPNINAQISEAIYYNGPLTDVDRQKINSYLAIKYGITLEQDAVPLDYLAGDATVIWDATNFGSFTNDVGGIGRDDCQGLNQKQSRSINSGAILTIGNGDIDTSNFINTGSFVNDESFLLWGNNGGAVDADSLPLPAGAPVGVNNWLERKWLAQEKGEGALGTILARFGYTQFSNLYLVTASDSAFTVDVTYTAMNDLGEEGWEIAYDFVDEEYFTLAGYIVSPGCVAANLQLWLKADYNSPDEDGTLFTWDVFGGNPDFEFAYTNSDPQFQDGVLNFNPVVNFDGNDYFRTDPSSGTLNYTSDFTAGEVLTVVRTTANNGSPYDFGGNSNTHYIHTNTYLYNDFGTTVRKSWHPQTLAVLEGGGTVTGPPVDVTEFQIFHSYSAPGDWASGFNGDFAYTSSSNVVSFASGAGGNYIGAGAGYVMNGDIGEVILYDRKLKDEERQRVVSYLAIKYGIELTNDYLAGDGATVWTTGGGYDNDIGGIGRDDCQTLNQKQSKSINADAYVTIGNVDIDTSNAANGNAFAADQSFMLWGNNDGVKGFVTPLTGTMLSRMDRVWKVEETGTVGTVKVRVPFSNINSFALVRSTDETFDNTDEQVAMTCDGTYCWASIDFADGDYFTFAGMVEMPFSSNFNDQFDGLVAVQPEIPPTRCNPNFWDREALFENTYTGGPGDKMTPGVSGNETTHLADVDNDGDLDIVWVWDSGMANTAAAGIYIWKNNGDGTFETSATTYIGSLTADELAAGSNNIGPGGVTSTESTHMADVNGDGNVDLVWMFESFNKIYTWLGNGNGTWEDAAIVTEGFTGGVGNKITPGITANESTFLVDVNTDGILDLAWVYDRGAVNIGGIYIWYGNGDGTWQTEAVVDIGNFTTGAPGHWMGGQSTNESTHMADFTNDGIVDIMWLWNSSRVSYVWAGKGDGTFEHAAIVKSGYDGGPTNDFNIGYSANETTHITDVDNDGNLDIVSTYDAALNPALAGVYIWYGLGDGTFETTAKADKGALTYDGVFNGTGGATAIALGGQSATEASHIADLNGDGAVDIMWLYEANNSSHIWLSTDEDEDGISDNTDDDDDGDDIADVDDDCESPGGVITDLALWLRSDEGTSTTTTGSTLELWNDQGPEGYNASQPTVGERPTYQADSANLFNFNPVIKFTGSKDLVNNCMPALDDENYTIFTVTRKDGSSTWGGLFSQNLSGNAGQPATTYILSSNDVGLNGINQNSINVSVTDPVTGQILIRNTGDTGDLTISMNGESATATGAYPGNPTGAVKGYYVARHNATLSQSLVGNMAEIIAYRSSLTTEEINQVETYLAVKYGLSLNHNYVNSSNDTLWNIVTNAAYSNDIAGLGRDDISTLYQKQSRSIETDALVTMGNGSTIEVDNLSNNTEIDDDQSYLIWGNDDGAFTTWENTNTISGYSRITRTWNVAETATAIGPVKIRVPDDGSSLSVTLPTEIGSVYFLVDDDGDFTNGGATAVEMSMVDTNWEIDYDFSDGEYFTFAISCPPLTIDAQPMSLDACPGESVDFIVEATGSNVTYQWQEDQGGGFADLVGETDDTLSIIPGGEYGYQVILIDDCGQTDTSDVANVAFLEQPTVTSDPANFTACEGNDALFSASATGEGITYQWQEDQGGGFADLAGQNASSLTLSAVTAAMDNYTYRVVVSGTCTPNDTSAVVTLTVNTAPTIATQPVNTTVCAGETATFTVDGGMGVTYQWERSTNGGTSWSPLGGATADSYTTPVNSAINNGYLYRVQVTQPGCSTVTSDEVLLTVEGPLVINTDPVSQTICAGEDVTFSVTADGGAGTLAYQWQVDDGGGFNDLVGETNSTLNLTSVTNANNGFEYQVIVSTGACAAMTSAAATLTVEGPLVISVDPTSETICAGEDVSFSVTADGGAGTLSYQWQVDEGSGFNDLVGETNSTLALTSVTNANNGFQYQVIVSTGACAAVTSAAATLSVEGPLVINTDPASETICAGEDVTFSVTADGGSGTLAYQWQVDEGSGFNDLVGETNSTLNLTSVTNANDGFEYQVIVSTGACAAVTSAVATLTVEGPIAISVDPASQTICAGEDVTFSVTADGGSGTLSYQWQVDEGSGFNDLVGETNSTLSLTSVTNANDGFQYQVIVSTGACAAVTSAAATLSVEGPLVINTDPTSETICAGEDVTFSVTADGGSGTLAYQWQVDEGSGFNDLVGETNSTLNLTSVTNANNGFQYQVIVSTGACAAVTSATATLTVEGPLVISVDPASETICAGEDVSFSVTADGGAGTLSYQWQVDEGSGFNDLVGETNSTLNLTSVTNANNGFQYQVIVSTGACAAVTSATATLTVEGPLVISVDPASETICAGEDVSFSVTADGGAGTLSYQWQVDEGSGFNDLVGETNSTLNLTSVTNANNGFEYQVIVSTGACAAMTSAAATLTVEGPIVISVDPTSETICAGEDVSFSVTADGGAGTLSYQWQVDDGGGFSDLVGETNSTLALTSVTNANDGFQYQVIVSTGACAEVTSAAATLTVEGPITISTQPEDEGVCDAQNATFSVVADGGSGTLAYQWQQSTDGGSNWSNMPGETSATLTLFAVVDAMNGYQYRVMISTGACSAVTSDVATLTVEGPIAVSQQPMSETVCSGEDVTFEIVASTPNGTIAYQWYRSTNGGGTYTALAGETGSTLSLTSVTTSMSGYRYRVGYSTGACSEQQSSVAILTVEGPIAITVQPQDKDICEGDDVTFNVTANAGSGTLSYQWQVKDSGGPTWADLVGETSASFTISGATVALDGNEYRVLLSSGACAEISSDSALLNVSSGFTIDEQPMDVAGCVGETVQFSIDVSGGGVSYQWQVSTNGGSTWNPISLATASTLNLTNIQSSQNNNQYRVLIDGGSCGMATSDEVTLTVEGPIMITTQPTSVTQCAGTDVSFTAAGTAGAATPGYQWEESTDGGSNWNPVVGATTGTLNITGITAGMDGNLYRMAVSTTHCATVYTNIVTLSVDGPVSIDTDPDDLTVCVTEMAEFAAAATNAGNGGLIYQWQVSSDNISFADISNGAVYADVTTDTLTVIDVTGLDGMYYRLEVQGGVCDPVYSNSAQLTVDNSSPSGSAGSDETICGYLGVTYDLADASVPPSFADGALSWTSSGSGSFNNANIIHPVYTPTAADISGGSVSLVLVVSGTGNCSGNLVQDEMELTFDVANAPTVNAGPNILVCTNDLPIDFSMLDVPPVATNGTVTWTKPGSVTGTFNNPNLITPIFTPSMADISNNSVTLTMTVQGSGGACSGVQLSDAITISFTGDNVLSAELSTSDPSTICSGDSVEVVIDIVGGTPPYNVAYTDGTNQFMINDYDNGSTFALSPTTNVIYELVYVEDAINCPSITVSGIVPVTVEGPVSIVTAPVDSTICADNNASFFVVASEGNGGSLGYQWEVSSDGGSSWNNITDGGIYSGANSDLLSLTGVPASIDGYQYRVQVGTTECSTVVSDTATLNVEGPIAISMQPGDSTICEAGSASFTVIASGGSGTLIYQWEESTDGGSNWSPISNGGIYSGATTDTLMLTSVATTNDGYQYRVQVSTGACNAVVSSTATLGVEGPIDISADPSPDTICAGDNTSFTVTATGGSGSISYQWEESTDSGSSWNTIVDAGIYSGATTSTLTLTAVPAMNNGYLYRVQVGTNACSPQPSSDVALTVNSVNLTGLTLSLANECGDDEVTATLTGSLADDTYNLVYDLSGANSATGETAMVTTSGGSGSFVIPFADFPNNGTTTVTITNITAQSTSCSEGSLSISANTDVGDCDVLLPLKVFLQGPYVMSEHLMHDSLRAKGLLPLEEPYTDLGFTHLGGGGETVMPTMFDLPVNPEDAIVDWIFIELRDASNPANVLATRTALLQRDGDIVDTQGEAMIRFAIDHGDYFVAIRHRNHLAAMTKAVRSLSNTSTLIDFRNTSTENNGLHAQKEVETGVMSLWAGNADHNDRIIYVGAGTDVTALSTTVLLDPGNVGVYSSSYPVQKYDPSDLNMDGKVVYVGAGTDQTVISLNVLLHPANTSFSQSEPIIEQLP